MYIYIYGTSANHPHSQFVRALHLKLSAFHSFWFSLAGCRVIKSERLNVALLFLQCTKLMVNECLTIFQNKVPSPVTVQMLQRSQVTGSCPPPQKIEKRDCACLISNFRNVSLHRNPLQSSIVKYNKNETCGNLLLKRNSQQKTFLKACRSYDGEVMPFFKLPPPPPPPPQNSCVTSKAKGPFYEIAAKQVHFSTKRTTKCVQLKKKYLNFPRMHVIRYMISPLL